MPKALVNKRESGKKFPKIACIMSNIQYFWLNIHLDINFPSVYNEHDETS